jgi:hypothetical protein
MAASLRSIQTAIAQFDDVVIDAHDQPSVNPHVAKFVDDHRNALVVLFLSAA